MKQSLRESVRAMSDQEVQDRYSQETLKLKTLLQVQRPGDPFLGYPNTAMMNCCKQELEYRSLPVPQVVSPGGEKPPRFPVTKTINRAVLDHHRGVNSGVFCEVERSSQERFVYQVWEARTRRGVLYVHTLNGWAFPDHVWVCSTENAAEQHTLWEAS
ncbi:hypothetical protein KSF_048730 [Reticulibacter mediterranei]|uniref:Uncharacterized protein n=1 Tax=Reticulibacter mediterranei TaxID=2778369 RepID=A0A8J3N419_9CHLR|nr:hypothetical protein [Reticulibacter mediterranei]GHO94825.1 hypothetical protein KSF_048730 [Reticulibacter mediterranei]